MTASMTLSRDSVAVESTWNKESVFTSWEEWDTELDTLREEIPILAEFSGKLSESPDNLADWFDKEAFFSRRLRRLMIYVGTAYDVDTSDKIAQANRGRMMGLLGMYNSITAFAIPEIQALGGKLSEWANQHERLTRYAHHFDDLLRQKSYTRSAEVEEILGMLQDPFSGAYNTANILANNDLKFPDAVDSQGASHFVGQATITPVGIQSPDREHRRTAWQNYCDGYLSMQNTFANTYLTAVKQRIFQARVRGYDGVLHSMLEPNNMPVDVFHTLINTFKANSGTWHRYWEVKAKALGVDKIHPYDIWAPIVQNDPAVDYREAIDWISAGAQPLGDEYMRIMRRGCLEERWVDYAPNQGKMQGARAGWAVDCHPFVVMSYSNTLMSVSVLSHELGHAMHSYLMDKHQPDIYNGGISSSVAETASNFNQALTRAYLMEEKRDDAEFQLALIDEAMFNFHRYFFQMPTLARFEFEVFDRAEKGQPLNADILNGIMRDLFAEGYGDTMADDPDRTQITWAQFQHLYYPFYTFQYSVGISAAHALADGVLQNESGAADRYLDFLKAGSSKYTMDLFETAGVDMHSAEPIEKTFKVLDNLVNRLDEIVS